MATHKKIQSSKQNFDHSSPIIKNVDAESRSDREEELLKRLISMLQSPNYVPCSQEELMNQLIEQSQDRPILEKLIQESLDRGVILDLKRRGIVLRESADLLIGTLSILRNGAGLVYCSDRKDPIFIPAGLLGTALPGDIVWVRVHKDSLGEKGQRLVEGKVIRIEERRCRYVVGTLTKKGPYAYVIPMQSTFPRNIMVPNPMDVSDGERVLVELHSWEDPGLLPNGEIVEVLGPADNPQLDTLAVMKAYQIEEDFCEEALREAEQVDFSLGDCSGRVDLRGWFIFTIDPSSARDYDDAISLRKVDEGIWEVGVHVADVAHFVPIGSFLDQEARKRGTSVYFPDKVIPMLPIQLSNGICSLSPGKDRLAVSVIMKVNKEGEILDYSFVESVIRSQLRLTYHQALTAINSGNGADFTQWGISREAVEILKTLHQLTQKIRRNRLQNGALDLDIPQCEMKIGKDGRIESIMVVEHDPAHQLIEELMVLANECVSRYCAEHGIPQIYRIHEEPDPEKLAQLEVLFMEEGLYTGNLSDQRRFARFLKTIEGKPKAHLWHMQVLRSLKRAIYSVEEVGHYGLAKRYYCHFTSPIRRYPDLVMHRIIKAVIRNDPLPYRKRELEIIAQESSEREAISLEAEREVLEQKKMRYFLDEILSGNRRVYRAMITDVYNYGVNIEVESVQVYGMIHVSHLGNDFFDFIPDSPMLRGRKSRIIYEPGMWLDVMILKVDTRKRYFDFIPVELVQQITSDQLHELFNQQQEKEEGISIHRLRLPHRLFPRKQSKKGKRRKKHR